MLHCADFEPQMTALQGTLSIATSTRWERICKAGDRVTRGDIAHDQVSSS